MSMDALLEALKSTPSASKGPDLSSLSSDAPAPDDDADSAEKCSKIVDLLQTSYPKIFAKLSAQVDAEDQSSPEDDAAPDAAPAPAPMIG